MSVEKLSDTPRILREECPFTQIPNTVIEHIKDNDAFRVYAFLYSKDREWVVVKEWTRETLGISERKARQIWSYLNRCKLIEYRKNRNTDGTLNKPDVVVLNGLKFNPDVLFENPKEKPMNDSSTTGAETAPLDDHWCRNPPSGQSGGVENAPLLKKDITNKDFDLPTLSLDDFEITIELAREAERGSGLKGNDLIYEHKKFYLHYKSEKFPASEWEALYIKWMIRAAQYLNNKRKSA